MTSDGRTRSIQHPDSSAACHYFCLLTPIVLFLFLWNIEFHMAGCESVIHLEISLYFHNKSLRLNKCSGQRVSYETLIVFVNAALLPSGGRERAGMISH